MEGEPYGSSEVEATSQTQALSVKRHYKIRGESDLGIRRSRSVIIAAGRRHNAQSRETRAARRLSRRRTSSQGS